MFLTARIHCNVIILAGQYPQQQLVLYCFANVQLKNYLEYDTEKCPEDPRQQKRLVTKLPSRIEEMVEKHAKT